MKLSPQITQINTDYKKIKKISVISVICGFLFSSSQLPPFHPSTLLPFYPSTLHLFAEAAAS